MPGSACASVLFENTGSLAAARSEHTATLLQNGKLLVAGGEGSGHSFLARAELYDQATGVWTPTGSLLTARMGHTATLLKKGKVLVVGGQNSTIRRRGFGRRPKAWRWDAHCTLRACSRTARCWLQVVLAQRE